MILLGLAVLLGMFGIARDVVLHTQGRHNGLQPSQPSATTPDQNPENRTP